MALRIRNYRKEYDDFHAKPREKKRRAGRNAGRAKMKAAGRKVAGKDVDHRDFDTTNNSSSNLRVLNRGVNRARQRKV